MMILNIFFMITCYPIIFLMYFLLRNAGDKNNWCFGATLGKELKKHPDVEAIDVQYRKNLKHGMVIMGVIPLTTFFIPYMSIGFTIWMIWILAICFIPMIWYAKANKQIRELKRVKCWSEERELAYTDLKSASVPRKVKLITFLPALFFSIVPIGLEHMLFGEAGYGALRICIITFGLCTLLFYWAAIWTDKQKVSVISEDSDTNMNFARAKKQAWKNFWLLSAWINTAFTWSILLAMYFRHAAMLWIIIGTGVYCVIFMVLAIRLMKKLMDINQKYDTRRTIADAADDDRCWPYGLFYYNKRDSHFMVENRMGTGTAVNMATGFGKGIYIFATLTLLIIPISCIWLIMLDFTPIQTSIIDNKIVCEHLSVEYEIPLEDIESYMVVEGLPEMTKLKGNGMDHVLSGTYEIYREGMFEAFLNPQNDLFIKIVTEDETYYISGVDDVQTQVIIEEIKGSAK